MRAERRILALGDSYTVGEGVAPASTWPMQLTNGLRAQGTAVADPVVVARTGWTTDELHHALAGAHVTGTYFLVTLLIGANNQFRGLPVEEYQRDVRLLLRSAVAYAGGRAGHVVMLSIPDWGVTPYNLTRDRAEVAREIDAFNAAGRAEALAVGAHWVDITPLTRAEPGAVTDDGLHPNAAMYSMWVDVLAPTVETIVRGEHAAEG